MYTMCAFSVELTLAGGFVPFFRVPLDTLAGAEIW